MTEPSLEQLLETCESAARAGGQELVNWRGKFEFREKGAADFVTDGDLASQAAIRWVIEARFPDHAFIGEEKPPEDFRIAGQNYAWVVDPLDGTTNYIHNYPHYAVSVALASGGEPVVGVIYDPVAEKCFSAAAGRGAWCNGDRLQVSKSTKVADALVAVSLPARVRRDTPDLADFIEIVQRCQAMRRSGSAALNLAYLAAGLVDAFWATHIHPWDVAAGVLLVREAGGHITGRDGSPFDLWQPHFVAAATPELHQELLQVLTPAAIK